MSRSVHAILVAVAASGHPKREARARAAAAAPRNAMISRLYIQTGSRIPIVMPASVRATSSQRNRQPVKMDASRAPRENKRREF